MAEVQVSPAPCSRTWPAIALGSIGVLLGASGLVVALTRPTAGPATAPSYTAAETAAAHQKLCDVQRLAMRAVQIDTNGDNPAYAGIATVNAAVMLEQAVRANTAIASDDRTTALTLAQALTDAQAKATGSQRDDPVWRSTLEDVNEKIDAMKKGLRRSLSDRYN